MTKMGAAPCPFCGGERLDAFQYPITSEWCVRCLKCDGLGPPATSSSLAWEVWNERDYDVDEEPRCREVCWETGEEIDG